MGEGDEDKVLSLLWHCSAALLLCQVPPLREPRAAWKMDLGKPHTASCGVLLWLQEDFTGRSRDVVLNPCFLSQGQGCKPPMKCKVLVVCYLDT